LRERERERENNFKAKFSNWYLYKSKIEIKSKLYKNSGVKVYVVICSLKGFEK